MRGISVERAAAMKALFRSESSSVRSCRSFPCVAPSSTLITSHHKYRGISGHVKKFAHCLQDGSISQMAPGDTTVGRTPSWQESCGTLRTFVGLTQQCNELIVGCADPDFMQIGHVSYHAINDGMWVIDALGGKLLHVLIDLRCKLAKFIHAHALLTLSVTLD
jgi:hypothetical protein